MNQTAPFEIQPGEIVVVNCGSQTAHLIANEFKLRVGVKARLCPAETPPSLLRRAAGIVISGSPSSVYEAGSPKPDAGLLELGIPVLGLCYGMHIIAQLRGGVVKGQARGEYGRAEIRRIGSTTSDILDHTDHLSTVWMSHGDHVIKAPDDFEITATSDCCNIAAFAHRTLPLFGLQFHPEVQHTVQGRSILTRFAKLCKAATYSMDSYLEHLVEKMRTEVGDRNVLMLLSGGVDSTVAFTILTRALGPERVRGLLVDTGLMRENEVDDIMSSYRAMGLTNVDMIESENEFLNALLHCSDPQEKREAIGRSFVAIYRLYAATHQRTIADGWILGQGTLYPDWIESGTEAGSDHIKLHHNMHALIASMRRNGCVVEPLRELYKDEVRRIGEMLDVPRAIVWRQPFPGPGLAVRTLCSMSVENFPRLKRLLRAWTWPRIEAEHEVLPVQSVGVQGDKRSYTNAVALFMGGKHLHQLHWYAEKVAPLITNRVRQVNRVVVCVSHYFPTRFVRSIKLMTQNRIDLIRRADDIVRRETAEEEGIWQFPVVLIPCGTKPGQEGIVLRPVESTNAMTATPYILKPRILGRIVEQLLALPNIDCVFYDITNKPPGTIEWE